MMTEFPWIAKYPHGVPAEINPDVYPHIPAILDKIADERPSCPCFTKMWTTITAQQTKSLAEDLAG